MKNPRVSILIPTYNRETLILKALDSIFKQTFQDYEIMIIDDASTDNTEQVIKDLNHPRVRYFKLEKNGGQCIARNYGARQALGEFLAFLDSDDEWLPEKLEKQISLFDNGSERMGGAYGLSYTTDVIRGETSQDKVDVHRGDIHNEFLKGFCPPTPSMFVVKREAFEKVNGFDENLLTFVDLDLWMRISEFYDFDYVDEPVIIKYEQIGDQYVNNFGKRYRGYHLFMDKWSDSLFEKGGRKLRREMRVHLIYALIVPILDHPPINLRKDIFKLIGLLFRIGSIRPRLYVKAFMILLFGPNIIYRVRSIRGN